MRVPLQYTRLCAFAKVPLSLLRIDDDLLAWRDLRVFAHALLIDTDGFEHRQEHPPHGQGGAPEVEVLVGVARQIRTLQRPRGGRGHRLSIHSRWRASRQTGHTTVSLHETKL